MMIEAIFRTQAAQYAAEQSVARVGPPGASTSDTSWCRREDIIASHEQGVHRVQAMSDKCNGGGIQASHCSVVKPQTKFPTPAGLAKCTPVLIQSLHVGTTHRGRMLRGTLVVDPFVMTAIHTVLEDAQGHAVKVGASTKPQPTLVWIRGDASAVHIRVHLPKLSVGPVLTFSSQPALVMLPLQRVSRAVLCAHQCRSFTHSAATASGVWMHVWPTTTHAHDWDQIAVAPACVVLQVCVYNMLPEGLSMAQQMAAAKRLLPRGKKVGVIEPFFKRMVDGALGVRVDNPLEVRCSGGGAALPVSRGWVDAWRADVDSNCGPPHCISSWLQLKVLLSLSPAVAFCQRKVEVCSWECQMPDARDALQVTPRFMTRCMPGARRCRLVQLGHCNHADRRTADRQTSRHTDK
jgi:hypothetical protein